MFDNDFKPVWAVRSDEMAIGFAIIAFIVLLPVLPAGDIGLYIVSLFNKDFPKIVYIVSWLGSVYLYYRLFLLEIRFLAKYFRFIGRNYILIAYLQGIVLSYILEFYNLAIVSKITVKLVSGFVGWLFI